MTDLRERFDDLRGELDRLETPDLWSAVDNGSRATRGTEPGPAASRARRVVALVAAFAIFLGTAGVFGWRLTHPSPTPVQEPSPSPGLETVQGVVPPERLGGWNGTLLAMDFPDPDHGYLIRCTDGGGGCTQAELLASSDGGSSWQVRNLDAPEAISFVDATNGFGLIRTCDGTCQVSVVHTNDGGSGWATVGDRHAALGTTYDDSHLSIDFVDGNDGWILNGGHLFASRDGGTSWNEVSVPCTNGWELTGASLADPSTGFAVCEAAGATDMAPKEVFRTNNAGATWQTESAGGRSLGGGSRPDVGRLEIIGYNSRLRFVTEQVGFLLTDRGGLDMSTDGGVTFTRIVPTDDIYSPVDVAWLGSGKGYLALYSGELLETTDGGSTWSQSFPTLQPFVTDRFSFANERSGVGVGTSGVVVRNGELPSTLGLYTTLDGGLSWTGLPPIETADGPTLPGLLQMASPEVIIAQVGATRTELYRSSDAGRTWHRLALPGDARPGSMSWVDESTGFVLTRGALFRTMNGGRSWDVVGSDVPFGEIDAGSASELWDLTFDPQPAFGGTLWRSTDAGATWTEIEPVPGFRPDSVSALDPLHVWIQGVTCSELATHAEREEKPDWCVGKSEMVLLRTGDGGASWQAVSLPHLFERLEFISPTTGYAYDSRFLVTRDGGVTWERLGSSS